MLMGKRILQWKMRDLGKYLTEGLAKPGQKAGRCLYWIEYYDSSVGISSLWT